MMVMTAKVDMKKMMLGLAAVAALILSLILLLGRGEDSAQTAAPAVSNNDARVKFLQDFGWDVTNAPAETEAIGAALGKILPAGTVIAYRGDLGAGKTAFTRGLARGLGFTDMVTSPTYTIVNEYLGGRLPLFHFDMYRLSSSDDLFDIGWEDYLQRGGVCAVEWSENVDDAMEDAIYVKIEKTGEDTRCITIEGGESLEDISL